MPEEDVKYGMEQTEDVVVFILDVTKALSDGFQWADIVALKGLPAAIAGIDLVPDELEDMDPDEKAKLLALVQDKFDIPDDQVEDFVEKAFAWILDTYELVEAFKDIKK